MMRPFATADRSSSLYGTARWKHERAEHLALNPHCRACLNEGRIVHATVVDHDPPHRGDEVAFWDRKRFVSLCKAHHDAKTGSEVRRRASTRRPAERHPGLI